MLAIFADMENNEADGHGYGGSDTMGDKFGVR